MTATLTDHAIEILAATHDGEDLDPKHLKLVELAVNGFLNDTGRYLDYAHSEDAEPYVKELARRCILLEGKGIQPTTNTVVWRWDDAQCA